MSPQRQHAQDTYRAIARESTTDALRAYLAVYARGCACHERGHRCLPCCCADELHFRTLEPERAP